MKRSVLAVAALALATAALSSTAQAQMAAPARPFTVGVSAGASIPTGDLSDKSTGGAQTGFNVNGIIGYEPSTMPFGLRGEVMYNRFAVDKNLTGGVSANYSVLGGNVDALFSLGTGAGVRPYLIGGIGYSQLKASANQSGASASVSKSGIGFNGGIGFKFPLGELSTFAEARYHYVNTKDDNLGSPNASFVPISFGILF